MTQAATDHWKNVRQEAEKYLATYLDEQTKEAGTRSLASKRLWQLLNDVVLGGGKRMRPYLVVWAYEAYGGKEANRIIGVAAAWELVHQGLLIHDDIIDRDYVRHGQPNIAGKLQSYYKHAGTAKDRDHYANSGALLAGDLALSAAYQLILTSGFTPNYILKACQLLGTTLHTVIEGELLDTEAVMEPLGKTDSLLVAELKTASYSFIGPLQTGAILAGASSNDLEQLAKLGNALGIAFQLSDDMLGLFGDEEITGKSNTNDVHEGKRTLLLEYAFAKATPDERAFLKTTVGNPAATPADIERFRKLVIETGSKTHVEDLIARYIDEADTIAHSLSIDNALLRQAYQLLTRKLRKRVS